MISQRMQTYIVWAKRQGTSHIRAGNFAVANAHVQYIWVLCLMLIIRLANHGINRHDEISLVRRFLTL
jgi:hypothetical protein